MKVIPPSGNRCTWMRHAALVCAASGLFLVLSWAAQESRNTGTGNHHGAAQVLGLGEVTQVAYAPDGRKVAFATTAGVEIWNAGTWRLERHLIGHTRMVQSVAWSPDSSKIVSGADDGTIRIWDARTGQTLRTLEGDCDGILSKDLFYQILPKLRDLVRNYRTEGLRLPDESVRAVAWSPDGNRIVSVAWPYSIKLWDVNTGKLLRVYATDISHERGAIWLPDGRRLLVYTDSGITITCEAQTGNIVKLIDFKGAVTYSPDGRKAAVSDYTHRIRIWDVQTGGLLATLAEEARFARPQVWSLDSRKLAYIALSSDLENDVLNVWDMQRGRISTVVTLGNTSTWGLPYTWSPDARKLLIPGKPLRIWDAQNEALLELPSPGDRIRSIAWAPDAHTFILVGGKTVTVWDAQTGKPVETLTQRSEQRGLIAWSPDGRKLAAAYTDRTIKIWDPRAGAVVNTLMAHTDRIHALAWVSDTDLLTVEQNEPQTIEIWDPQTGIVVRTFAGPVGWISQVAWAPDYSRIAFQAGDDTVKLWDVQTGDVKAFPSSYGQALTWSPDGKRIAVGGRAAEISLWDAGTGKLWNRLATDLKPVRLLWSPDGQRIATIGWQIDGRKSAGSARLDFTIQDAYTGAIIKTLAGQSYSGCYSIGLTAMVWSPDGDRLAWASGYNTIKILDGKSGDVVDTLTGLIGWPKALAWQAGEGDRLAWDAGDGTVRVRVLHEGK